MGDFITIVVVALGILLVFQSVGYGLAHLVLKYSLELKVFLAPAFGLTYTATVGWWLYYYGQCLSPLTACLTLAPAIGLSGAVLLRKSRTSPGHTRLLGRRWLLFMRVWLPVLTISVLPLCVQPDAWLLSYWNLDLARHTTISRVLQEQGRFALHGYAAQNPHDFVWFATNTYFGYYGGVATIASLFRVLPHEVVSAILVCVSALSGTTFYLFVRRIIHLSGLGGAVWSVLCGVNALSLYVLYHGWGGQVFGVGFAFAFLYLAWRVPPETSGAAASPRRVAALGVMLLGLALCYQHMLAAVLGLALVWRLAEAWVSTSVRRDLPRWVAEIALSGLFALLLVPQRLAAVALWTGEAATLKAGWPVRFLWPDFWLGLVGTRMHFTDIGQVLPVLRWSVLAGLGLLLVVACRTVRQPGFQPLRSLIVAVGLVYALAMMFSFLESGPFLGTYKSFKLLSFFAPLPGLLVAACWWRLGSGTFGHKACALIFLGGYALAWGLGVRACIQGCPTLEVFRQTETRALQNLHDHAPFASVNLDTGSQWRDMWLTYFFLNKSVYLAKKSYYPASASLAGEVGFFRIKPADRTHLFALESRPAFREIQGLTFVDHRHQMFGRLGRGWYEGETTLAWMGRAQTAAEIEIFPAREAPGIVVVLHLVPFLAGNEYSVEWNGRTVQPFTAETVLKLDLRDCLPGRNILRLRSKLVPQRPANGDSRLIAFGISRIELAVLNH